MAVTSVASAPPATPADGPRRPLKNRSAEPKRTEGPARSFESGIVVVKILRHGEERGARPDTRRFRKYRTGWNRRWPGGVVRLVGVARLCDPPSLVHFPGTSQRGAGVYSGGFLAAPRALRWRYALGSHGACKLFRISVGLLGLLSLANIWFHCNLGIDKFVVRDPTAVMPGVDAGGGRAMLLPVGLRAWSC